MPPAELVIRALRQAPIGRSILARARGFILDDLWLLYLPLGGAVRPTVVVVVVDVLEGSVAVRVDKFVPVAVLQLPLLRLRRSQPLLRLGLDLSRCWRRWFGRGLDGGAGAMRLGGGAGLDKVGGARHARQR